MMPAESTHEPQTESESNSLKMQQMNMEDKTPDNQNTSSGFGVRHFQISLMFCCMVISFALRVNLSVAIVVIVDNSSNTNFQSMSWDEKAQSLILSSFFWGYVVAMIPSGEIVQKFGSKVILLVTIGICSLLTLLTPIVAQHGYEPVLALRFIQGLCQAAVYPCAHNILSKWAPVEERGVLTTFCYAGSQLGTVLMLAASGFLAEYYGWPSIFYVSGGIGVVWVFVWFFYGENTPEEYSKISLAERQYITKSLGEVSMQASKQKTPWKDFFTSKPFWALIICHMAHNWGFWLLLTQIPTYMKNVLKLDIKNNALLSALPYLAMFIMSFIFSYTSDFLISRGTIRTSASRKIFNSIGHWIPGITLISLGYLTQSNVNLAVGLLTIAVGINAATYVGFMLNHMDLAPNFAGTMMGITNFCGNLMSVMAPLLVGFIVHDLKDPGQWRIVFFITGFIYFIGNLMFVLFGKSEIQFWNDKTVSV